MLQWVLDRTLKFRRLVVAIAVGVVIVGITQVGSTQTESLREYRPPTVEVQTDALGLSAAEVEQFITVPLEQDLLVGVAFLDEIESVSLPGLSSVVMTFEPGTDLMDARQVVQERLVQAVGVAGLPQVSRPPQMIQPLSSQSRVSMIKLQSEQLSPIEVSVLARWVIGPRLMSVPGVANVAIWGNRDRQLQVQVDPARLQRNGTRLNEIIATAGNALEVSPLSYLEASSPGTGGFIDTPNQRLNIFHEQAITSPRELAQVPLEDQDGNAPAAAGATTLDEVTEVVEDHQPLIGDAVCSGGEDCLLLVVEKFPDANTSAVANGVDTALAALRPGLADLQMDSSVYRPAADVDSSFQVLGWGLLVGTALLAVLLGLLFWSWRRTLVAVSAIVVSASAALAVLALTATTVDLLVAAGLVLGLTAVIHDAVSDTEALDARIRRHREESPEGMTPWRTIVDAATEMRGAIGYAVAIVAAASIPLFVLGREGGEFLPSAALAYIGAIAVSMVVALTLTPVLALLVLARGRRTRTASPVARALHRGFDRRGPRLVGRTGLALGIAAVLTAVGAAATPFLDTSFKPTLKESTAVVELEAPQGTSLPRMTGIADQAVAALEGVSGVASVTGHVGRAMMSDQIVDVNSGQLWVSIDPNADYGATMAAVKDVAQGLDGVTTNVRTYSEARVSEILGRPVHDIVVRVYGENPQVLDAKAQEIQGLVTDVDGVRNATVDQVPVEPTIEVEVDLQQAQALGVKPGDVRRAAAILLGGITVGHLFQEQKVFDVVVWGAPEIRDRVADIAQLRIDTPGGGQIRLDQVADVRLIPDRSIIRHESVANYLDVTVDVADRDLAAVAEDVDTVVEGVEFPFEHHAEIRTADDQGTGFGMVTAASVAAALVVLLLLQAAFGSWRLAALALALMVPALAGGVVAALLTGTTVSLGSIVGLLGVLGLASRTIVVLIRRYQHLERGEGTSATGEIVLAGTRDSLVPVLGSLAGSALLLLPFVVMGARPGFEILHPMAVTVLGGLVSTMLVALLVVPPLYLRYSPGPGEDIWADQETEQAPERTPAASAAGTAGPGSGVLSRVRKLRAVVASGLAMLTLSSCAGSVLADAYVIEGQPARLVEVPGTDRVQVAMTRQAAQRIGLETAAVERVGRRLAVPTAATFVDPHGHWWVYTSPKPLTFERHPVEFLRERDGTAFLKSGPPPGTQVVVVGVQEIHGVENEVAH